MLQIKNNIFDEEWEYDGLKVIQTPYPDNLYIQLFHNNGALYLKVNDKNYNPSNTICINEYTKSKDLNNLTRNNVFIKNLSELAQYDSLFDIDKLNTKIDLFNENFGSEFVKMKMDKVKILTALFELNDESLINEKELKFFLENNKNSDDKKLIILVNISWLNIKILLEYLNYYDFIVITSNFIDFFKNYMIDNLDGILLINNKNKFTDLIDLNKLAEYLIGKTNTLVSERDIIDIICSLKTFKNQEDIIDFIKKM